MLNQQRGATQSSSAGPAQRLWTALVVITAIALGCSANSHGADAAETVITIKDFSFMPPVVSIPVGSTVTWINQDDEPHTVVAGDALFRSPALDTGESFSFTFSSPGKVEYLCSIHAQMSGRILITAGQP
jgi:plastocyanin